VLTLALLRVTPFDFAGSTVLEANGKPVPLARRTLEMPRVRTMSMEVVQGEPVRRLLDTLRYPVEVVVSGTRSTPQRSRVLSYEHAYVTGRTSGRSVKACAAAHGLALTVP
jgi:hypothetical protein